MRWWGSELMSIIKTEISGLDDLKKSLNKFGLKLADNAIKYLNKSAVQIHGTIIKGFDAGGKTGNTYFVPKTKVKYTASSAGEYPAVATGNLKRGTTITYANMQDKTAYVIARAEYAEALEYGTRTTKARPFMKPSLEANKKNISKNIKQAIKQVTK